jgi:hypothetical protein
MLEWTKIRDGVTCEIYYKLWDKNLQKYVVQINQINKRFRVQISDHVPFDVARLKVAKEVGQLIHESQTYKVEI